MSGQELGGIPVDDILVVCASTLELGGALPATFALGVGKVAATAELYSLLLGLDARRPVRAVLLFGVAGAVPDRLRRAPAPVRLGEVCVVGSDLLADEGVATPQGFVDFGRAAPGQPRLVDTGPFPANPRLTHAAAERLGVPIVRGATVSTCSGADALAKHLYERTGADVESMEGAAVASVCRRRELPLLQVRAISNWTGDRDRGEWNLGAAVDAVHRALARLWSPA